MPTGKYNFDELIHAVLLLDETKDASPFIAVISNDSAERFLCFGNKEELIKGLSSEFWKPHLHEDCSMKHGKGASVIPLASVQPRP